MDYFEYDPTPDIADKRRLNRAGYAARSLPFLLAALAFGLLMRGIMKLIGNVDYIGEAFDAIILGGLASFGIFHYHHKLLERRGNDAEADNHWENCLFQIGTLLTCGNGIFYFYGKPLIIIILIQFAYGMLLPDNPQANIHGAAKQADRTTKIWASTAWFAAALLLFYLIQY